MKFKSFLLDQWLQQNATTEFNLGGSTGPRWTVNELLDLAGNQAGEKLLSMQIAYPPTAGAITLREAIGEMEGVQASDVIVLAGAAEALLHIFYLAAEPSASAIIPFRVSLRTRSSRNRSVSSCVATCFGAKIPTE